MLVPGGKLWLFALNPLSPYRWRWNGNGGSGPWHRPRDASRDRVVMMVLAAHS